MKRRLIQSTFIVGLLVITTLRLSSAFFSDTETSTGNVLAAGAIDLKVDNTSYYNGVLWEDTTWDLDDLDESHLFLNFTDIKPGDWGEDTISLHVDDNEAWACVDLILTANDDNSSTEPELEDGDEPDDPDDLFDGELAQNVNFIFWVDDGDNVFEDNENITSNILVEGSASDVFNNNTWALADSATNHFGEALGQGLHPQNTYYIGKAWCFGSLTKNPVPEGQGVNPTVNSGILCDGASLDNTTQTDSLLADFRFRAVQHRNNPDFLCDAEPTPPPVACIETFAVTAHENNQGTRKNGSAVLVERSDPAAMFGAPQTAGAADDVVTPPAGSFFSLGFDGSIVVGFSSPFFPNPLGPDLQVFEVTVGDYGDEKVKVEVGPSAAGPWTEVAASATRDTSLEMGVASAQFVRLTDVSAIGDFEPTADAYDVDAVKAFCTTTD